MRRAHYFIAVVIVSLLIAAAALFPGREERAAMLAGEGRHEEAIVLLRRQLAVSPHDPDLLAALGRSYAALGDVDRAIDEFETYLAARPEDLETRERLARLLLQSGRIDRYLDAQARLVALQPSPARITRLLELFRLHGRIESETAMLKAWANKAMLDVPQLERLGAVLAARGDWHEAQRWLELADQKAPTDASTGRLLLLEVLIESNEVDRIYERTQVWMMAWRSTFLAGKLILRLAQAGLTELASRVALKSLDVTPNSAFEIAGLLAAKGCQNLARRMLAEWADRTTKPTGEQLRAFVQTSERLGDVSGPFAKLMQFMHEGRDAATQGGLAAELAATFGLPALAGIRPLLSNDVLLTQPIFAAELSLFEGNREMARWFLDQVEPAQLPSERLKDWLALLHRVQPEDDAFSRLAMLWGEGRLPIQSLPQLADEAVKLGQVQTHDLIWDSIRQSLAPGRSR